MEENKASEATKVRPYKLRKGFVLKEKKMHPQRYKARKLIRVLSELSKQATIVVEKENKRLETLKTAMMASIKNNDFNKNAEFYEDAKWLNEKIIKNVKALETLNDLVNHSKRRNVDGLSEKAAQNLIEHLKLELSHFKFYVGNKDVGFNEIKTSTKNSADDNKDTPINDGTLEVSMAEQAVLTAEQSMLEEDIKKAYDLVEALKKSKEKDELYDRLLKLADIALNKNKEAEAATQVAEKTKTKEAVETARKLVSELSDETKKSELSARLDKIKSSNLDDAKKAFEALKYSILEDGQINKTKELVENLPNGVEEDKLKKDFADFEEKVQVAKKIITRLEIKMNNQELINQSELDEATKAYSEIGAYNNNNIYNLKLSVIKDYYIKNDKKYNNFISKLDDINKKDLMIVGSVMVEDLINSYRELDDVQRKAASPDLNDFIGRYNLVTTTKNDQNIKRVNPMNVFKYLWQGAGVKFKYSKKKSKKASDADAKDLEEKREWKLDCLRIFSAKAKLNGFKAKLYRNHDINDLKKKQYQAYHEHSKTFASCFNWEKIEEFLVNDKKIDKDLFDKIIILASNSLSVSVEAFESEEQYLNCYGLLRKFIIKAYNDKAIDKCQLVLYKQELDNIINYHNEYPEIIYDNYLDLEDVQKLYTYYDDCGIALKKMVANDVYSKGKRRFRRKSA